MTDEQMKKLLEEDTGEVPERFHQAMLAAFGQIEDEPFDGTELPISVEAAEKPRRPRHVPRQGGRFRRMMLVMLITLGLLGGLAVATTANPRLLEVFWGKDFEPSAQASAYIAHDLAEVETNGYRVRVEEAVYDGMTLYVRYSIRDMSCDHLLGETNVDTGRRMLNEQEITAFDHAPVGWWMRTGSRCGRVLAMAKATGALRTMYFRTRMRIRSRCILRRRRGRTARIWRGRFHSPCGSEQRGCFLRCCCRAIPLLLVFLLQGESRLQGGEWREI